jgi:hypothetical protein
MLSREESEKTHSSPAGGLFSQTARTHHVRFFVEKREARATGRVRDEFCFSFVRKKSRGTWTRARSRDDDHDDHPSSSYYPTAWA